MNFSKFSCKVYFPYLCLMEGFELTKEEFNEMFWAAPTGREDPSKTVILKEMPKYEPTEKANGIG